MRAERRERRRRIMAVLEQLGYVEMPRPPGLGPMLRFVHLQRARRRFVSLLATRCQRCHLCGVAGPVLCFNCFLGRPFELDLICNVCGEEKPIVRLYLQGPACDACAKMTALAKPPAPRH